MHMQRGNLFIITLMSLQMYISEYDFLFCRTSASHAMVTKSKRCQKGCRITIKVVQTTHALYCTVFFIALCEDKTKPSKS